MTAPVTIEWTKRHHPLRPEAVAARGEAAEELVRRAIKLDDLHLSRLRGVASKDLVVLTGEHADLPWVDGVAYLGRPRGAPGLFIPTTLAPTVPESLLARAVTHAGIAAPVAVLVDKGTLVSLAEALPLSREVLEQWLADQ